MRIICDIYPVDIADLETWRLAQLCMERAANIEELQTLIGMFRQRIAIKEEQSALFRDNIASIERSIEDMEESCTHWQREIDAMKAELKVRSLRTENYTTHDRTGAGWEYGPVWKTNPFQSLHP